MDFSEDWKSLWPISSVFSPPLLISGNSTTGEHTCSTNSEEIGPIIFNPIPKTLAELFTSPSLSPPLPPSFTNLSLTRFLRAYSSNDSSVLVSTSSSIASTFGPEIPHPQLPQNSLQLLHCPNSNIVIAFFPTGNNSDQIGYLVLSVENSRLVAHGFGGEVFTAKPALKHKIIRLSLSPVTDSCSGSATVGFLLAWTLYSVHWFVVKIDDVGSESEPSLGRPEVECLGSKLFKTCGIVDACWSPHLTEESVVLLESGEVFLFDLDSGSVSTRFKGKKLNVLWDYSNISETGKWVACDFGWHPRILIVAHSSAVFLVDLRSGEFKLSCLLKIDTLRSGNSVNTDRFVAFAKTGCDGFYFTVASTRMVVLCDVRKPMMPLLQWVHFLDNPVYITVFKLSELRSHTKDDKFSWASESGYCILLGSFWNCEFNMFCFGPPTRGTEISRFCKSMYAWGLPSKLSLTSRDCECGNCLIREESSKDSLPQWINWQHKKEIVLGLGVLDNIISVNLSEPDDFGGFTLIRLTSAGKLELQRYCASWNFQIIPVESHKEKESSFAIEDSYLYAMGDAEYKLDKRFRYLKLDCLKGYLEDNLGDLLVKKLKRTQGSLDVKKSFGSDFHQHICQKLKACGVRRLGSSFLVDDMLADVSMPTSVHEVGIRSIWESLPMDLLRLSFSTYSEFLEVLVNHMKVSPEFLEIPDGTQLPPFSFRKPSHRSSKWTHKLKPADDAFVGPVVPLPFLVSLRNLQTEETEAASPQSELNFQCSKIIQAVELQSEHAVSLADDNEDTRYKNGGRFDFHKPVALCKSEASFSENQIYTTCIYKTRNEELASTNEKETVGLKLFDTHCPLELKFDDRPLEFGLKELQAYKMLKRQQSIFEKGFGLYQDYLNNRSNVQ